jgi:hypothetical protein
VAILLILTESFVILKQSAFSMYRYYDIHKRKCKNTQLTPEIINF